MDKILLPQNIQLCEFNINYKENLVDFSKKRFTHYFSTQGNCFSPFFCLLASAPVFLAAVSLPPPPVTNASIGTRFQFKGGNH